MAGGSGTRFWPASRNARPKQFLKIGSERTLLRQTAERVLALVGWDRLIVVTGAHHAEHAHHDLPELPAANLLKEPVGRNTAPCIGWATDVILARDPEARIAVLSADHFIADEARFRGYLEQAFAAASDRIVLFGIEPDRPETGYGYIQRGQERGGIFEVQRFVEKPDRATAEGYLAEGTYLWNSGMFVFPARLMRDEIEQHLPDLDQALRKIAADATALEAVYPRIPSISIDYGIMEKTRRVAVLAASFGWSDVGSWDAAMEIYPADVEGNVLRGDVLNVASARSMVDAETGRLVALVGVEDVIVVDTPDALLVMRRGRSQDVKKVVEALKERGKKELL